MEILDLNGVATYEDISGLFGMPALRELYLNGVECELDFGKLSPNGNLEVVEMDGVKLYKNVQISGGGGIVYVDYDKVSLDEHTDFLGNYPGLKSLSLSDNMLTGTFEGKGCHVAVAASGSDCDWGRSFVFCACGGPDWCDYPGAYYGCLCLFDHPF